MSTTTQTNDPLPSWNEGASKQVITQFANAVTTVGGSRFVPLAERIAVFDNDGTLWGRNVTGEAIRYDINLFGSPR